MSGITTHVLDTSLGRPAAGVPIVLEVLGGDGRWRRIAAGETDSDGRLRTLTSSYEVKEGRYRLIFDTGVYFRSRILDEFFPEVIVTFEIRDAAQHYHVPLLLSPFGYSTYRGS